jgi:hypothetical protein
VALLETFQDDFSGTPADRWDTSGTVSFVNQTAEISTQGSATSRISTKGTYEFGYAAGSDRVTHLSAKIVPDATASTSNNVQTTLAAFDSTGNARIALVLKSGLLYHQRKTSAGSVGALNFLATYDATNHLYWRIRAGTAGNVYFDTSPDGATWTQIGAGIFSAASNTAIRAEVFVMGESAALPLTKVVVDNVNIVPAEPYAGTANPDGATDPETLDEPTVSALPTPAGIADGEALGTPDLTFVPGAVGPDGVVDPDTLGAPSLDLVLAYTGDYGSGPYGAGVYSGAVGGVTPDSVTDPDTTGTPAVGSEGPPVDNPTYGTGTYGYGTYPGFTPAAGEALPLFPPAPTRIGTALHLLAIGPFNGYVNWRGAANYKIRPGRLPARPTLSLPNAQTKSFTLRLNEPAEARCEFGLARSDAIIVDEMVTDLWWRRKDPYTGQLEMIGRFNASHVDITRTDTGLNLSCQFEDYRQVLGDRLILRYLHPTLDPPTTMWDVGTKVTDVLAWALPKNTGIDLSAVTGASPVDLGELTQIYHLPLGTTIDDMMTSLAAVSPKPWEWWVDTPTDVNAAPKLTFTVGQRGADKGVTLFDYGAGPTPIANWTRRAASDQYANSLFYSGSEGGVAITYDAQILEYGQRDAQDGNNSLKGDIKAIMAAADQRLRQLADRRPTFTVTVKPGWWRGRAHVDVGDIVRIEILLGEELVSERYRVSEIQCDIDATGVETVTFTFGNPLPSGNPRSKKSPLARLVRKLKTYQAPPGSDRDVGLGDDSLTYYVPNESDAPYVGP